MYVEEEKYILGVCKKYEGKRTWKA